MTRARCLVAFAICCPFLAWPLLGQETKKPEPLMRKKLIHAQKMLEGITMEDYGEIEKNASELLELSKKTAWRKQTNPKYESQRMAFQRACDGVIESAKAKNLDGATLAYMEMTMSCVKCHKYTREMIMTRLTPLRIGDATEE